MGYEYAHDYEEKLSGMSCLPERFANRTYYTPTEEGFEKRMRERMARIREAKQRLRNQDS